MRKVILALDGGGGAKFGTNYTSGRLSYESESTIEHGGSFSDKQSTFTNSIQTFSSSNRLFQNFFRNFGPFFEHFSGV